MISQRKRPAPRRKSGLSASRSLVLIDGSAIRKKARRDYDKALRDIEKARAESERYRTEDLPAYQRWLHQHFGKLLTDIRSLQEKLFTAQQLIEEVEVECFNNGHRSLGDAYRRIKALRENPELAQKEQERAEKEEEEFDREFEEIFGNDDKEFFEKLGFTSGDGEAEPPSAIEQAQSNRVKELYRALVRRLHPDKNSNQTAQQLEWWHQTQAAYESADAGQLQMILTLVEMQEDGAPAGSVSILQQLTAQFKASLRALRKELTLYRRELAWGFSRLTDLDPVFQRTRSELEQVRERIVWTLGKYESQIQLWEEEAARPRKRVRSRRSNWQDEEWF